MKKIFFTLFISSYLLNLNAQNVQKFYHDNGNIEVIIKSEDGSLSGEVYYEYFYETGELRKTAHNLNNKLEGEVREYYINGNISQIQNYIYGIPNGLWQSNYDNGNIQMKGLMREGLKNGEWSVYHSNGFVAVIGVYKRGKPIGEWRVYDDNGKLVNTESF